MKILTCQEASALLGGPSPDEFVDGIRRRLVSNVGTYLIPSDSGVKTALARDLAGLLLKNSTILLYITSWTIWPSSGHLDLLDGYRRSLGENRQLKEAPLHVLSQGDEATFTSILALVLYFVFDAEIFDTRGATLVTISHDEWIEFRSEDRRVSHLISQWASRFQLEPLKKESR